MLTTTHITFRQPRHTAALSAIGGTLWLLGGTLGGASGHWTLPATLPVLAALPLLLTALHGLVAHVGTRPGVPVRLVQGFAWAGAGLAVAARIIDLFTVGTASAPLFGIGTFLLTAALLLLGSAALRTTTGAGWEGLLLLVGLVGLFLPVGAGVAGAAGLAAWLVWGCGWIAIGNVLWQVSRKFTPHKQAISEATTK